MSDGLFYPLLFVVVVGGVVPILFTWHTFVLSVAYALLCTKITHVTKSDIRLGAGENQLSKVY